MDGRHAPRGCGGKVGELDEPHGIVSVAIISPDAMATGGDLEQVLELVGLCVNRFVEVLGDRFVVSSHGPRNFVVLQEFLSGNTSRAELSIYEGTDLVLHHVSRALSTTIDGHDGESFGGGVRLAIQVRDGLCLWGREELHENDVVSVLGLVRAVDVLLGRIGDPDIVGGRVIYDRFVFGGAKLIEDFFAGVKAVRPGGGCRAFTAFPAAFLQFSLLL
mmetsp:Transcript_70418/g.143014  ORF Transcript_70418/g.143014 Transcript_70418/m.143014 type:complete len:218 (-) Transcript_70418:223-876(-)